jgi:hypothetical protein
MVIFDEDILIAELLYINSCREHATEDYSDPSDLITDPRSINCVMKYISRHGLFEELCYRILADAELATQLTETTNNITTISLERLTAVKEGPLPKKGRCKTDSSKLRSCRFLRQRLNALITELDT